uniref:Uncharacterized protein n=1 Tax=Parascaris equorum TaxID=6256 RepID=A0A914R052_PAREQ
MVCSALLFKVVPIFASPNNLVMTGEELNVMATKGRYGKKALLLLVGKYDPFTTNEFISMLEKDAAIRSLSNV